MKYSSIIFLAFLLAGCSNKKGTTDSAENNEHIETEQSTSAIEVELPLQLESVTLNDMKEQVYLNDEISTRIEFEIAQFGKEVDFLDSMQTPKSLHLKTLKLNSNSDFTLFLILFKHYPASTVSSRALFYNDMSKKFIDGSFEFNIYALYNLKGERLIPSNLKTLFDINSPEIELIDYNNDGKSDYKFSRLWHNGTYNSMITTVLAINDNQIDTLARIERPLRIED